MAVFQPNLTTRLLLAECQRLRLTDSQSLLEVGCGSAFIAKSLVENGHLRPDQVWLSDISSEAIEQAIIALRDYVHIGHFRIGSCLGPWADSQFDVIVSDVAGIADEIASVSSWYQGVPYAAGPDGLDNTLSVLYGANSVLKTRGVLIFPIISLSNVEKLHEEISDTFEDVRITEPVYWPMPQDLVSKADLIDRLCDTGMIRVFKKFGKLLASTQVAVCTKGKS